MVISLDETTVKTEPTKETKNKIVYIERNGRIFTIIEHFSGKQTYADIVKNALRREAESV